MKNAKKHPETHSKYKIGDEVTIYGITFIFVNQNDQKRFINKNQPSTTAWTER